MELKGSRTEANLTAAFAGESQARNKYTYYAVKAREDGYRQIAEIFTETACNELAHAAIWFRLLHGGAVPETAVNLADAAAGELYEWSDMYKKFAEEARAEGFGDIARLFEGVASIEKTHEERFRASLQEVKDQTVFQKGSKVVWQCGNCGFLYEGEKAPEKCPVCSHPKAYFSVMSGSA